MREEFGRNSIPACVEVGCGRSHGEFVFFCTSARNFSQLFWQEHRSSAAIHWRILAILLAASVWLPSYLHLEKSVLMSSLTSSRSRVTDFSLGSCRGSLNRMFLPSIQWVATPSRPRKTSGMGR